MVVPSRRGLTSEQRVDRLLEPGKPENGQEAQPVADPMVCLFCLLQFPSNLQPRGPKPEASALLYKAEYTQAEDKVPLWSVILIEKSVSGL